MLSGWRFRLIFRTYKLYHLWGGKSRKMGTSAPFSISIKILRLGRKRDGYKEKNNEIKKRRNP